MLSPYYYYCYAVHVGVYVCTYAQTLLFVYGFYIYYIYTLTNNHSAKGLQKAVTASEYCTVRKGLP